MATASADNTTSPNGLICRYCGSGGSVYLYATRATSNDQYSFHRCLACDGVFLTPRPSASQLAEAYSDSYYGESSRKFVAPVEWIIERFRSSRARRVAAKLGPSARVLDLGCGNGQFLSGLATLGVEAHGIELPGRSADRAIVLADITVHVGTLEESAYITQTFDAITLWHVFEHLAEPRRTLELLSKMLKPGGRLYLSLPNHDSFQARVFKGDWLHHDPPRHLFYFGPYAMRRELEALGLQTESTSFWSLEQNPFGIVQSILNRLYPDRDVLYESLKGNQHIVERYGRLQLVKQQILGGILTPFALLAATFESAAGHGGTMEIVFKHTGGTDS